MDWGILKKVIGKAAPLLGKVIEMSPGGSIVTDILASTFKADNTPDAIAKAIDNDPDAYLKLQELEKTHKVNLEQIALKETIAHLDDRSDARTREVDIIKATGKRDIFQHVYGGVVSLLFTTCVYALIFKNIESNNLLMLIIGSLVSQFTAIVQYYFGSSKGSETKTHMLGK